MAALRSFVYQHGDAVVSAVTFCAADICTALKDTVGNTLEHLCLNIELGVFEEYMKPIQDLKGFSKLKSLEFELRWLLCDEAHELPSGRTFMGDVEVEYGVGKRMKVQDLNDIFPPTIKSLKLETTDYMEEMFEMVEGLHEYKDADLPNLRYIDLAYDTARSESDGIKKALKQAGVKCRHVAPFLSLHQKFGPSSVVSR